MLTVTKVIQSVIMNSMVERYLNGVYSTMRFAAMQLGLSCNGPVISLEGVLYSLYRLGTQCALCLL